jgi:hypothetical protein
MTISDKSRKTYNARGSLQMAKGVQAFRANEIKRAVDALQESGVKIARVSFENGRFDIIAADGEAMAPKPETAAERWLREQKQPEAGQ